MSTNRSRSLIRKFWSFLQIQLITRRRFMYKYVINCGTANRIVQKVISSHTSPVLIAKMKLLALVFVVGLIATANCQRK